MVGLLALPSEVRGMVAVQFRRIAAACDATAVENNGSNDGACAALTVLARAGLSYEGRGAFPKSYAYEAALRHLAGAYDEQERLATIVKKKINGRRQT